MSDFLTAFRQHQLKHNPRYQPTPQAAIPPRTQTHEDRGFNSWTQRQRDQQRNASIELASKICQLCKQYPCICTGQ